METMSMVSSILGMQQGNLQDQIATTLTKQNLDAEKSAVQTLLGTGTSSTANLGAGIGGNLDVSA
ncbi:putative motility protein [Bradyrhizobium genosp. P]|uniref:putative motility protein n=1 Tax=Bradyrhizobium genosp. P TaxID=83641 RepID=UPI003CF9D999